MTQWLKKIWESDTIYEEPVCFLQSNQEEIIHGKLVFAPTKILKVTSADGKCIFEEGVDFKVEGKEIIRTAHSRIPVITRETYINPYIGDKTTDWLRLEEDEYYVKVFTDIYQYQVLVTYQHNEDWEGYVPKKKSFLLPRTMEKLSKNEHLKLVFYGDSITAGWEASGCDEQVIDMHTLQEFHHVIHRAPYLPTWSSMVTSEIKRHFGYEDITKVNRGAGGSSSAWGNTNAELLVNPHNPDFVVIAFGMNNMQDDPEKYKQEILGIMSTIRNQNPVCEFLLVSAMIPSPEIRCFMNNKLSKHEEVLNSIQNSMEGVVVAPVNTMFHELERYGKKYLDLTGNCINHPNDYSVRIYAQTILSILGI